jgi:hypothetical protein
MPQNIVSHNGRPPGKLLPGAISLINFSMCLRIKMVLARGTLFLSRPETVGAMGVKYILLNFTLFMLPFFALGFTICAFGDRLGIYRHESPLALWYNLVYFGFSSGLALLFIGEPV